MRYLIPFILLLLPLTAAAQAAPLYTIQGDTSVSWVAPTENVDGTPLTDLAGFKIYWGEQTRNYTQSMDVDDSGAVSETFSFPLDSENQLNWFIAMTALDEDGNESAYSNEILKVVTVTITDNRPPKPPVLEEVQMDLTCIGSSADIVCTISVQ